MAQRSRTAVVAAVAFVLGGVAAGWWPGLLAQSNPAGSVRDPRWQYGLSVKVRKGADKDFAKPVLVGLEVYRDENNGNLIYVTEFGTIAVVPERR
jgi:hypothetical protein